MTELTQKNYHAEVENSGIPVLIEFSASPTISAELTEKYDDRCKFCRVDMAKQALFAKKFEILHLPTSILLQNGKIVQRISGQCSDAQWRQILNLD